MKKSFAAVVVTMILTLGLSSCALISNFGEEVNRAFNGTEGTFTTYNQEGQVIDEVSGMSLRVERDERFDTTNSEGTSNRDSPVLLISVGNNVVSHVGSSAILKDSSIQDIYREGDGQVSLQDTNPGTPFLNTWFERNRNLWKGSAKTIMVRSQDGDPIAIFAGDTVEIFPTDVPKSTLFRVDGKYLLVYRSDYTVFDTDLLEGN